MGISYSYEVQQALFHACEAAEDCQNGSVGTEHLLIGILCNRTAKLTERLNQRGITEQTLKQEVQILFGFETIEVHHAVYTGTVQSILKDAEHLAECHKKQEVSMDELSLSLLKKENNVALELLRRSGIVIEELIEEISQDDLFISVKELRNLNQSALVKQGRAALREKEIETMIQTIMKMEKSNCVLVGPAGVGKTAIVEELAGKIARGQVPSELKDCIIAELNVNQMVAGTKYRGEFEARIQNMLDQLKKHPNVILFIDELHLIVGAGRAEGSLDIASVLKPVLSRSGIRIIGATTAEEYERWIEKDKALQRRFVRIEVKEPDEQMTLVMLRQKGRDLQNYHQVKFQKGLLKQCVSCSKVLFPHLKFPDKAIDLLDMSCALAKCRNLSTVTLEVLNDAAASLNTFSASMESLLTHLPQKIGNDVSSSSISQIHDALKQTLQCHSFSFVVLNEPESAVIHVQNSLKELLNAEIQTYHASLFKICPVDQWIKSLHEQLHSGVFYLIHIQGTDQMGQGFVQMIQKNLFSQLMNLMLVKSSLTGIVLMSLSQDKPKCGFGQAE